jgi:hypothetical protein
MMYGGLWKPGSATVSVALPLAVPPRFMLKFTGRPLMKAGDGAWLRQWTTPSSSSESQLLQTGLTVQVAALYPTALCW